MRLAFRVGSLAIVPVSSIWLALLAAGCGRGKGESENVCAVIGSDGGLVTSSDSVLTIALRPGALADDTEICVRQDDDPPDVFGPAYRVSPNVPLELPSTITYRYQLPAQTADVTIGKVDREEYEAGAGQWIPLPRLTIDTSDNLVKSSDEELALFYALLDEGGSASTTGNPEDSGSADTLGTTTTDGSSTTGTPDTGSTTEPGTTGTTDSGVDESSSDGSSEDTGVVYPPECDDIFMGPYPIVYSDLLMPGGGSEDLAMSGDSTFVVRDGTGLVTIDATANSSPHLLEAPFANQTLGLRYRADGDLLAAQNQTGELLRIQPNGDTDVFFDGLNFPNGIYPDADGNVWVTEYAGYRVLRIDPDGNGSTVITQGAATAAGANGILYDDLRQLVFWTKYDDSELWRAPIANDGTPGAPVMVANLEGVTDGLALDICGNIYAVDQGGGGQSRIDRVFLDGDGDQVGATEEIAGAGELTATVANAQFGYGGDFVYEDALYAVGLPGSLFVIDVQIAGHPIAPVAN